MSAERRVRPWTLLGPAAAVLLTAGPAAAQPGRLVLPPPPPPPALGVISTAGPKVVRAPAQERRTIRQRVGVDAARNLLKSPRPDERRAGVERLAGLNSDEAVDALLEALNRSALRVDGEVQLAAVRAMDAFAQEERVVDALLEVLNRQPAGDPATMVVTAAARVLARSGHPKAMPALLGALAAKGNAPRADAVRLALLQFPPPDLEIVRPESGRISVAVVSFLGDLGDLRALGMLRAVLRGELIRRPADKSASKVPPPRDRNLQAAARLALAKLGDAGALGPLLDPATKKAEKEPKGEALLKERLARARVEIALGHPRAVKTVTALLSKAATRPAGLDLAKQLRSEGLVRILVSVIGADVTDAEKREAVAGLAAIRGDGSAAALLRLLDDPALALVAARGLARNPSETARVGLGRAIARAKAGPGKRAVVHAAIAHQRMTGAGIDGLEAELRAMTTSARPADRAVAAYGLVALGEEDVATFLPSPPVVAAAAVRGTWGFGPRAWRELEGALPPVRAARVGIISPVQAAAGVALYATQGPYSRGDLVRLIDGGGPLAAPAAYRLASLSKLGDARLRVRLEGTDPLVRRALLLGLGASAETGATAVLARAYKREADPVTRRIITSALTMRSGRGKDRVLHLAQTFDPDADVRGLARAGLAGHKVDLLRPPPDAMAWAIIRPNRRGDAPGRLVSVVDRHGIAWPTAAPADGLLVAPRPAALELSPLRLFPRPALAPPPGSEQP